MGSSCCMSMNGNLAGTQKLNASLTGKQHLKATLQKGPTGVPMINGFPLVGDVTLPSLGLRGIYYDTTEHWNSMTDLVSQEGAIYIFSDYTEKQVDGETVKIPNMKIGDGTSLLSACQYVATQYSEEIIQEICSLIADEVAEQASERVLTQLSAEQKVVSPQDRINWNSKVSAYVSSGDPENLILTMGTI